MIPSNDMNPPRRLAIESDRSPAGFALDTDGDRVQRSRGARPGAAPAAAAAHDPAPGGPR